MKTNLGPMKYRIGDKVQYKFKDEVVEGVIWIADFGGSLEMLGKCHSYDIFGYIDGKQYLVKHVAEDLIIKIISRNNKIE
ncbi:hypothetical protein, partial [Companilactobacillus ginsenosidimutans]|uniref:hypothetical protein n=1 Tax=Companilactobacillus ginsenosidimutans TaxID=1007676 RepID=UPI000660CD81